MGKNSRTAVRNIIKTLKAFSVLKNALTYASVKSTRLETHSVRFRARAPPPIPESSGSRIHGGASPPSPGEPPRHFRNPAPTPSPRHSHRRARDGKFRIESPGSSLAHSRPLERVPRRAPPRPSSARLALVSSPRASTTAAPHSSPPPPRVADKARAQGSILDATRAAMSLASARAPGAFARAGARVPSGATPPARSSRPRAPRRLARARVARAPPAEGFALARDPRGPPPRRPPRRPRGGRDGEAQGPFRPRRDR